MLSIKFGSVVNSVEMYGPRLTAAHEPWQSTRTARWVWVWVWEGALEPKRCVVGFNWRHSTHDIVEARAVAVVHDLRRALRHRDTGGGLVWQGVWTTITNCDTIS
jgi:hypothetical protein